MLELIAKKRLGEFTLDVALRAPTPGVVALFGRSGCGKTTLIKILAGLLAADAGRAQLNDEVLFDVARGATQRAEQRRIGYVFQDARLFPHLNVDRNLRYAERRAQRPALIERDGVVAMLGLEPLLERRTQQLSGGERQRVAIGRALLSQPRLLILDEPLASLDNARRAEVLPYLELLRDQLSIPMVYVSHDFDEVMRLATHIVVMDGGSVLAQGDMNAVSMNTHLRAIVGQDAVGAVVDGLVLDIDAASGLTRVRVGAGELRVQAGTAGGASKPLPPGAACRIHILARDVIIATADPVGVSVRNHLAGSIISVTADDAESDLIAIDIGDALLLARITREATRELRLCPGGKVWALIKTVSLRDHTVSAPRLLSRISIPRA